MLSFDRSQTGWRRCGAPANHGIGKRRSDLSQSIIPRLSLTYIISYSIMGIIPAYIGLETLRPRSIAFYMRHQHTIYSSKVPSSFLLLLLLLILSNNRQEHLIQSRRTNTVVLHAQALPRPLQHPDQSCNTALEPTLPAFLQHLEA